MTTPLPELGRIRVMVVDDHPIVRQGVRSLLSNCADMTLVAESDSALAALETAGRVQPDVILLDIRMPGMTGVEAVRPFFRECPNAKILMLSSFDDEAYIDQAIEAGVHGYILKSASDETLVSAVRAAHRGERVLSPRVIDRLVEQVADYSRDRARREIGLSDDESRILKMLAAGASNPKIAAELYLSEATVKRKLQDIFEKLGVATRVQAAAEAVRRGLV
ncbi:MAG TPA: response regulator transcription factor [Anaerolineales bacterium]|nr:response regulator transcription factor [Anaerolineales bacterium]